MLNNFSYAYWSCGYLIKCCFKSYVHLLKPDDLSLQIGRSFGIYSRFQVFYWAYLLHPSTSGLGPAFSLFHHEVL